MPQFNFQAHFVPAVEAGTKCQTVRAVRKRRPRAGETAHLFTGMRTPACRSLGRLTITEVRPIFIDLDGTITLAEHDDRDAVYHGRDLTPAEADDFARADGFGDAAEFVAWIRDTHRLPFEGFVTYW